MRDVLSGILRQFGPASEESSGEASGGNVMDVKSGAQEKDLPGAKSMRVHPGKVYQQYSTGVLCSLQVDWLYSR